MMNDSTFQTLVRWAHELYMAERYEDRHGLPVNFDPEIDETAFHKTVRIIRAFTPEAHAALLVHADTLMDSEIRAVQREGRWLNSRVRFLIRLNSDREKLRARNRSRLAEIWQGRQ